jgi:hypothetical protein
MMDRNSPEALLEETSNRLPPACGFLNGRPQWRTPAVCVHAPVRRFLLMDLMERTG